MMFRKHNRGSTLSLLPSVLSLAALDSAFHHLVGPDSSSELDLGLSPFESRLACTLAGTGQLSVLATRLWVAPAESAERACWWERSSSSPGFIRAAALARCWPLGFQKWKMIGEHRARSLHPPPLLLPAAPRSSSSKGLQWRTRRPTLLQARILASGSASSQPEPPREKPCSSQTVFCWGSLLFPFPAYSKVACALTPREGSERSPLGRSKAITGIC